jgi:phytoene synthase
MSDEGFAEFERKWLDAWPENRIVAVFLEPSQRSLGHAFYALIHELSHTAYHVHEPQVAVAKLQWWCQELADATAGRARHPLTQALFAHAQARAVDAALWRALGAAALTQIEPPPAATFDDLARQHAPFYDAIARAESELLLAGVGDIDTNATLWTLSHLLHSIPAWQTGSGTAPLNLLARHGLMRSQLSETSTARTDLLRDLLGEIERRLTTTDERAKRSLSRRVRLALDRTLVGGALKAADPLRYLQVNARAGYWRSLWAVWYEARRAALN